ncbi:lipase [Cellulomonas humilata]|uniref:Lipase n=1 Tax=Cellulomonas humilata TaxID=144055 RepID=A0A7Y6A637_9CELL|nr:lipase [Cellulomonas humilata]
MPRRDDHSVSRRLRLTLGIVAVLLGAVLVVRPFSSLAVLVVVVVVGLVVLGIDELADGDRWSVVRGSVSLGAALAVVVWPGVTIRVLALVVAAAMIVDGVLDLARSRGVHGTARANAVVGGTTAIVLGLLALAWPDVTVLVVAVVFAVRLVIVGVREIVAGVRGQDADLGRLWPRRRAPRGGWWRLTGSVLGALVALVLVLAGVVVQRGVPRPDAFYDPPDDVPSAPGQLLRSEPFTSDEIPAGARAWRILYTTSRDEGRPAVASGLVVAPESSGPSPVIAWAHGTTGVASGCAPSVLTDGLSAGAMFVQDDVLAEGWALVAPDYTGLGTEGPHPYLIGQGEGRSVLDAVRAAHQLSDADLADETVVWGHSQGGHAALWTGMLAPSYAPELRIDGVAALAPASNLPALVDVVENVTAGELFASYVVEGYTAEYPDVSFDDLVRPGARIITREMAQRCLAEPGVLVSVLTSVALDRPIWSGDPSSGVFLDRLVQNVPSGRIAAPLLVAQGIDDALVTSAAQADYVDDRCAAGYAVDYRTYAGRGHVPLVEADSPLVPELVAWTSDRFAGEPATDTCP